MAHLGDLGWLADASPEMQDEVLWDLVADERCTCDHRDDQHGPDGSCEICGPEKCFAYNPIQQ